MSKRILVVDDDDMNRRMAQFTLSKEYFVTLAASGMECLEILQAQDMDLILLDIEMPVMNGFKTLEKIRSNDKTADIPVMFLTAAADTASVTEAGRLGAIGYVKKPFVPDELLGKVKHVFAE